MVLLNPFRECGLRTVVVYCVIHALFHSSQRMVVILCDGQNPRPISRARRAASGPRDKLGCGWVTGGSQGGSRLRGEAVCGRVAGQVAGRVAGEATTRTSDENNSNNSMNTNNKYRSGGNPLQSRTRGRCRTARPPHFVILCNIVCFLGAGLLGEAARGRGRAGGVGRAGPRGRVRGRGAGARAK